MLYSGEISWDVFEFIVGFAQEVYTKRKDYTAENKDTGLEPSLGNHDWHCIIDVFEILVNYFVIYLYAFSKGLSRVTLLSIYIH